MTERRPAPAVGVGAAWALAMIALAWNATVPGRHSGVQSSNQSTRSMNDRISTPREGRTMTVMSETRLSPTHYLKVTCSCGRTLRAAYERAGGMVRCWDCRREVAVPVPRYHGLTARLMAWGLRQTFAQETLTWVVVGALGFLGALMLPLPEPAVAGILLAALAFVYGELIRRWGIGGELGGRRSALRPRAVAARGAVTLAGALVLTNTWEWGRVRLGYGPGLLPETLGVAAALALVFPLAMLAVWAMPRPRQAFAAIARHPVATAVALMVVPVGIVAAEALVLFVTSIQGFLPNYLLDLYPSAEHVAQHYRIPFTGFYSILTLPDERHMALYGHYLAQGEPLSLSLPNSLMDPKYVADRKLALNVPDNTYFALRAFHTLLLPIVWLTALAVQARCLGLLARLWDWQRPRPFVEPVRQEFENLEIVEAEEEDASEPEPGFDSHSVSEELSTASAL